MRDGFLRKAATGLAVTAGAFLACSFYVAARYRDRVRSPALVPPAPVAVVFGAGLSNRRVPSPVLAERLDAALMLYRARKVERVLVSGDNTERYHDETTVMRRYLIDRGLPAADVLTDDEGVSTFDTCRRARDNFGVRHATLVTQAFHLPRALYIANALGIDAHGVAADAARRSDVTYALRETLSRPLAFAMVLASGR